MKHKVLSELVEQLASNKNMIIDETRNAWKICDFSQKEPDIIKSFVSDPGKGVDYLNNQIAAKFNISQSRFILKFGGVYAHQRPYVERSSVNHNIRVGTNPSESCELGNLLCIAVLVDDKKNVLASQASIFQAKVVDGTNDPKIDNQTQRWLYDFDDHFNYKSTSFWEGTAIKHATRQMPLWTDQRSSAFQYLLLHKSSKKVDARLSPWNVEHKHEFAFYLYRLLTFSAGKAYEHSEHLGGGWSSIVNDVLRMGGGIMNGKARNSPDLDTIIDEFNNFRNHDVFTVNNQMGGTSILVAIMQDSDHS